MMTSMNSLPVTPLKVPEVTANRISLNGGCDRLLDLFTTALHQDLENDYFKK